jgi:ubiquinone/menaquinone biosynthesis C-methylase UbiE
MSKSADDRYRDVAQANKVYYQQTAAQYDATETCVVDPRFQDVLAADLTRIIDLLNQVPRSTPIMALDACGGSGNVSLKLAKLSNVQVTLCDQSPELQAIFRRKCALQETSCAVVTEEISQFLRETKQKFDLIVFSSALHHLQDYETVLKLAAGCLNPGGYIFTVFDPIRWKFPARQIVLVEYICFKIMNKSFLPALVMKVRRAWAKLMGQTGDNRGINWGKIAEYHVQRGIDDVALAAAMRDHGLQVIWHVREPKARYAFFESVLKWCGCATTFKLLFQK